MDDLRNRILRLYAAAGEMTEEDLARVPGVTQEVGDMTFFIQDFSGDLSQEIMVNMVHTAISLAAHFGNHLRRHAKRLGGDPEEVAAVEARRSVATIIDLANREKHGPPRGRSRSGRAPALRSITRRLRLSCGADSGGRVQVQYTPEGPKVTGSGSATVILTGDVVASDGSSLGDVHTLLHEALCEWESLGWLPAR